MEKFFYESPVGNLEIIYENNELVSLKICADYLIENQDSDFIKDIKCQLDEYFIGKNTKFGIKINPKGTEFQKLVWKELQKIPYGETQSYSEIAIAIGKPNAQRAVGTACNKNPIMIIIPCHRVITKRGNLGGFAYGNDVKQKLLKLENCINS